MWSMKTTCGYFQQVVLSTPAVGEVVELLLHCFRFLSVLGIIFLLSPASLICQHRKCHQASINKTWELAVADPVARPQKHKTTLLLAYLYSHWWKEQHTANLNYVVEAVISWYNIFRLLHQKTMSSTFIYRHSTASPKGQWRDWLLYCMNAHPSFRRPFHTCLSHCWGWMESWQAPNSAVLTLTKPFCPWECLFVPVLYGTDRHTVPYCSFTLVN